HIPHKPRWTAGIVIRRLGNVMYEVLVDNMHWRRHTNQLRSRDSPQGITSPNLSPLLYYGSSTQQLSQRRLLISPPSDLISNQMSPTPPRPTTRLPRRPSSLEQPRRTTRIRHPPSRLQVGFDKERYDAQRQTF